MKNSTYILSTIFAAALLVLSSCNGEEKLGDSQIMDPVIAENDFDKWLSSEYIEPYNVQLRYRMSDILSDMSYNLIPASYEESILMAKITKNLVFSAYDKITGDTEFIRSYFPKIIHLIGSSAYNVSTGSVLMGTAEGGKMMSLYAINTISGLFEDRDIVTLNDQYFHTIHHEFAHILHQTKPYSTDFSQMTAATYVGDACFETYPADNQAWNDGYITPYASTDANEDFVEQLSVFLVSTDEEWAEKFDSASDSGRALLTAKHGLVVDYMQESWGIDLYELRDIVRELQDDVWSIDTDLSLE